MTLIFGLWFALAHASDFSDRLLRDVAVENAPWRGAPLVFLIDQDDGRSCIPLVEGLKASLRSEHVLLDAKYVRSLADVWRWKGADRGYVGSESETVFESFARARPRGFVLVQGADNAWGAQLVAEWLGRAILDGDHVSKHGRFKMSELTFVFQMPEHTALSVGTSVADLIDHAVASSSVDGCTYHVVNRLRAQARLGCGAALKTRPVPAARP